MGGRTAPGEGTPLLPVEESQLLSVFCHLPAGMEMTTKGGVSNEEEFAQRRHDEIGETKMNDDQGGLLVANKV